MSANKKLKQFIEYLHKSESQFAKECGISAGQISKIMNKDSNLGGASLLKITQTFPELNIDWLFHNRGKMTYSESEETVHYAKEDWTEYQKSYPLFNFIRLIEKVSTIEKEVTELKSMIAILKTEIKP